MNNFLEKNFTDLSDRPSVYFGVDDYVDSNFMYDSNVGISHIILTNNDGSHRIVSDVELVMTSDPSITCRFSNEYLAQLKNTILSKPHNPISNIDREGNPIGGVVLPNSLERDELANVIEQQQSTFHSQAVEACLAHYAASSTSDSSPDQL